MLVNVSDLHHSVEDGDDSRVLFGEASFCLKQGECIALTGDSGCGKTTILNLIAGLEPIQQGQIDVLGTAMENASEAEVSRLRKFEMAIIFQQFNLLSSLSVADNIAFSAKLAGRFDQHLANELSVQLNIAHLVDKFPAMLSGGEMQRVAIARALAARPRLILADEPTGNLDEGNSRLVINELLSLLKHYNTALLMVTHSAELAAKMDKVYKLENSRLNLIPNPL